MYEESSNNNTDSSDNNNAKRKSDSNGESCPDNSNISIDVDEAIDIVGVLCENRGIRVYVGSNGNSSYDLRNSGTRAYLNRCNFMTPITGGDSSFVTPVNRVLQNLNLAQREHLKSRINRVLQTFGENSLSAYNRNPRIKDAIDETIREFLTHDLNYNIVSNSSKL